MDERTLTYLSRMPHFSFFSKDEMGKIAGSAVYKTYPERLVFAVQGQTEVDNIFVVEKGALALYDERDNEGSLIGHIKAGEVFGGITILLNGGISLRTAIVKEKCSGYLIPREIFQDLCTRSKLFYDYFLENFSSHIADPALKSIIETGQFQHFLSEVAPFSFLPPEELDPIAGHLSMVHYPKDTVLFIQGRSRIGYLYIL